MIRRQETPSAAVNPVETTAASPARVRAMAESFAEKHGRCQAYYAIHLVRSDGQGYDYESFTLQDLPGEALQENDDTDRANRQKWEIVLGLFLKEQLAPNDDSMFVRSSSASSRARPVWAGHVHTHSMAADKTSSWQRENTSWAPFPEATSSGISRRPAMRPNETTTSLGIRWVPSTSIEARPTFSLTCCGFRATRKTWVTAPVNSVTNWRRRCGRGWPRRRQRPPFARLRCRLGRQRPRLGRRLLANPRRPPRQNRRRWPMLRPRRKPARLHWHWQRYQQA